MAHVRMKPEDRKQQLVESGIVLLREDGFRHLTRIGVAAMTGTTDALVNRYFGSRDGMRAHVIEEAARRKDVKALAQVIVAGYTLEGLPRQLERDVKAEAAKLAA